MENYASCYVSIVIIMHRLYFAHFAIYFIRLLIMSSYKDVYIFLDLAQKEAKQKYAIVAIVNNIFIHFIRSCF